MDSYSSHPESGHSSPQSRETDFDNPPSWDDSQGTPPPSTNYKVKFMCSYAGKIHPRPHDNQLSYIGGETKILAVDRNIKFAALLAKLMALCDNDAVSFKYQLPGEDLDALISVTNDDDLEHMMHEYDRLSKISPKPARLRIFIFPSQSAGLPESRSFGSDEAKTDRFVEALNSAPITTPLQRAASPAAGQPPSGNADFLFGLDKGNAMAAVPPSQMPAAGRAAELEDPVVLQGMEEKLIGSDPIQKHIQDLQRLRIEEQHNQGIYRRRSDENLSGGLTGVGEYYKVPDKISQVPVAGGVPSYWTEKQVHSGGFPLSSVNSEHPYYMIPAPSVAFPSPIVRPATGAPTQGYYTVQRIPPAPEPYRDQTHIYNMISQSPVPPHIAAGPPQKVAAYTEGHGVVRPATAGVVGLMADAGYAPLAYDGGGGRHVIYTAPAPGGVMGSTTPVQSSPGQGQFQAVAAQTTAATGNVEGGAKVGTKATQASV